MSREIPIIINKLISMRRKILQMQKSKRPAPQEHEAIMKMDYFMAKRRTADEWKEFANHQMEQIRFIAPGNRSAKSLLSKLNTLIQ